MMERIGEDKLKDASAVDGRARAIFKEIDSDGNNQIDPAELKAAMASMGVTLKEKEVKAMMEEADEDGDGFIDIEEFANLVKAEVDRWLKKSMLCVVL